MTNLRELLAITVATAVFLSISHADPWADSVVWFEPGPGSGFGQEYFPDNVLGPPDSSATPTVPASSQEEILALGSGGVIVLEFTDNLIIDLPGPDFTVFENPFWIGGNPEYTFVEAGIVAVSKDGVNWCEFPYNTADTLNYSGLAGVTPTNGWADPTDPAVSGGDSFDLSDLGLDLIHLVRITDAGDLVQDMGPSFDLDAVVAVHSANPEFVTGEDVDPLPVSLKLSVYPNPCNPSSRVRLSLEKRETVILALYNAVGKRQVELFQGELDSGICSFYLATDNLSSGRYFLRVVTGNKQIAVQQITVIK